MNAAEQQAFDKMREALESIAMSCPPPANEAAHLKNIAYKALVAAKAVQVPSMREQILDEYRSGLDSPVPEGDDADE